MVQPLLYRFCNKMGGEVTGPGGEEAAAYDTQPPGLHVVLHCTKSLWNFSGWQQSSAVMES